MNACMKLMLLPGSTLVLATGLRYRVALPADYAAVGMLRTEIFSPHLTTVGSRYLQSRMYSEALQSKTAVIIAEEIAGGKLMGTADLVSTHFEDGAVGYVTNVCVHSQARRRGIGAQLVAELEELAAVRGLTTLALHVDHTNQGAIALYLARDFVVGGEERLRAAVAEFEGAASVKQHLMTKQLDVLSALQQREPEEADIWLDNRSRQPLQRSSFKEDEAKLIRDLRSRLDQG
eukprot:CAMPEP_0119321460 /NCGR_PEP_ID=MMETSP1333-20130426/55449_1 /TAXON_ID=418940 /ORGANISM="Scyphosphaera apsteinii, Strain RCC1455" /LENGTH=232 /DNA_ID=CAMNT_0007328435 /DNA_START=21 /DNA_END=719 /DNA_ORIENTATION=-